MTGEALHQYIDHIRTLLESKEGRLILTRHTKIKNRNKWKRFSSCAKCNAVLFAYLEKGHTFDEVIELLHRRHPEIKHIRKYAQHAVRSATGMGLWDDYIYEHKLWPLRSPLLIRDAAENPIEQRALLEKIWKDRADKGRELIALKKRVDESLDRKDEIAKLITYAAEFIRFKKEAAP